MLLQLFSQYIYNSCLDCVFPLASSTNGGFRCRKQNCALQKQITWHTHSYTPVVFVFSTIEHSVLLLFRTTFITVSNTILGGPGTLLRLSLCAVCVCVFSKVCPIKENPPVHRCASLKVGIIKASNICPRSHTIHSIVFLDTDCVRDTDVTLLNIMNACNIGTEHSDMEYAIRDISRTVHLHTNALMQTSQAALHRVCFLFDSFRYEPI